ncbi:MAG: DNA-binding response regulator [Bacteroidetes bacterium]|nr:response regulator transcription factor [Bacteroidia bacterium]PCH69343.1 MAG: DNA-binding response regulator [Bacteroidota bacterium]
MKVLVVDDEPDIIELIEYNLVKEGYKVYTAGNGEECIKVAEEVIPDLIILDIMMPKLGGIETCSYLRTIPSLKDTAIIFLTARNDEYSEVTAFTIGAEDFISKPIKPKALVSRINNLLKRRKAETVEDDKSLVYGDLVIDPESYTVTNQGQELALTKKEFELLQLLAKKPGKVFSRDIILEQVWGDDIVVNGRTVDVHIRKIREKLNTDHISTIKGVGYKFVVD